MGETEGDAPLMFAKKKIHFVSPADNSMTPDQLREWQDALNALMAEMGMDDHKIIVLPAGSRIQ